MQNAIECLCGNSYGKHGLASDQNTCNYKCKDNQNICGGAYRNNIYLATLDYSCTYNNFDEYWVDGNTQNNGWNHDSGKENGGEITLNCKRVILKQCGGCWGAEAFGNFCCSNCQEVINAYQSLNWNADTLSRECPANSSWYYGTD